jgi:hypothetical protein
MIGVERRIFLKDGKNGKSPLFLPLQERNPGRRPWENRRSRKKVEGAGGSTPGMKKASGGVWAAGAIPSIDFARVYVMFFDCQAEVPR